MEVQFLRHIWKGVQKTKECIQVRILLKNGVVELNSEMAVTGFFSNKMTVQVFVMRNGQVGFKR